MKKRRGRGPLGTLKGLALLACIAGAANMGVANILWATQTTTTVGSALLRDAAMAFVPTWSLLRGDADAITTATRSGIPHLIHFVWVSMAIQTENNTLSDMAQGAVASWRELYPD